MKAPERTSKFSPNPRPVKRGCRMISLRTQSIRTKTYELERLADRARGDGSRDRLNEAARKAEKILIDVLASEGRFINARESHEDAEALRMGGLDVVA